MNEISIDGRKIGGKNRCFVIAEAGSNFRISANEKKNFRQALRLIDIAAEAGADAVKFQLYRAKKLYVADAGRADYLKQKKPINSIIREMELPFEWIPRLGKYCKKKGIVFLCTPFDTEAVDELEKAGISAYKVGSYAISHLPLIKYIARKAKPVILSCGASDYGKIKKAIGTIKSSGNSRIVLMQCTTKYPTPLSAINLRSIPYLSKKFRVIAGLSDHSREPLIAPLGAVALGAKAIEKHFTTDNSLPGPDHKFAVLPDELKEMVSGIRKLEEAMGKTGKQILDEEKELFNFCDLGIFAIKKIHSGEIFSEGNIAVLRPGKNKKGLAPEFFDEVIGKKAKKNIGKNQPLKRTDF
ncbi:MAG: N-acetylneuraminate synthase family protein [Candidatus ainarchaeum sp.]|nr:N-acetylneuraminate synthase family protein [Candidatus ainarchaeum sp.]